jgi:spermidine synthase
MIQKGGGGTIPTAALFRVTVSTMPRTRSAPALLLLSGAGALICETLWVKQLSRVVGVEIHAVTIALSAFFAGLAVGSAVFGRMADRGARPLRLYAALEAGAAVLGLASTVALARAAPLYVSLQDSVGVLAWLLPCVLVAAPACLIGGTLPVMLRAVQPDERAVAPAAGLLYAANTMGAVGGTLATPFLLVPAFGILGAGLFACALQLTAAGAALAVDRRTDQPRPRAAAQPARDVRLALALYAGAGGVAMGYEVIWSELLVQFLSTRAYAFAVMLATYLAGLALGSYLFARSDRRRTDPWRAFGLLIAGAGASAIVIVALLGAWITDAQTFAGMWAMRATGSETVEVSARFVVAALAVLLVPTTLLGAALPAASRLTARAASVGQGVGVTLALNTFGGIGGTLLTGLILVPWLGLVRTLGLLAIAGAIMGAIAFRKGRGSVAISGAMVAAIVAVALFTPPDKTSRLLAEKRGGELRFYEEGAGGTVAVIEQQTPGGAFRRLYIQGVSNSGDTLASLRYMRLQALLPLLIHPAEPRSALVVGLGTGITAGALLTYPSLERRVVAELLPAVVRAVPLFSGNLGLTSDSRVEIRVGDGRHELLRRRERYDLITLEPPPPSAAGVANLYSRDFYELCRDRLHPGGLMAQWWPLPAQNDEDSRSLVRSFLDVFPYATVWTTELHEMLLVGSTSPITLDGPRIAARFSVPDTARVLREAGIESAAALLATWIADRTGLEAYAGDAAPVTDDRPIIEHAAWVRRGEFQRVLPRVLAFATDVPLRDDDPLRADVQAERRELLAFYRASLLEMEGQREEAARLLAEPLGRDPRNPYYLWFTRRR